MLQHGRDLCCALDEDATFTWVNAAWVGATGLEADQLLGRPIAAILASEDAALWRAGAAPTEGAVTRLRRPDGAERLIEWRRIERDGAGGLTALAVDVTEGRARRLRLEALSEVARRTDNLVVICDADRRITWINEAFERASGYRLDEVIGQRPGRLLHCAETDPAAVARVREALNACRPVRQQLLNADRHGRRYWIDLSIQPTFDADGALTGFIGVSSDVTDRREHELRMISLTQEAMAARERLLTAVEAMPDAFAMFDAEDRLTLCNRRYRELYALSGAAIAPGATFEEILRAGLAAGQHPEAAGREEAWLKARLAMHRAEFCEVEERLADGRWIRVIERAAPDGGKVGMCVDVTRARQSEHRLASILRGSNAGAWAWNVATGEVIVDERWASMLGWTVEDLAPFSMDTWSARVHPDDIGRASACLEAHVRGETETYECEVRMRHRDGRWVWIMDRGRLTSRTADGQPEWCYGVHLDITQLKLAEARLAESRRQMRAVVDALPDGVVIVDVASRRIVDFNPAAPATLGCDAGWLQGRLLDEICGNPDAPPMAHRLAAALSDSPSAFETVLRRRDGRTFPAEVRAVALSQGPGARLLTVMRDISDQRRQTEDLRDARDQAEAANAAKSRFLAAMSHEIRTPMNGVLGMAEALERRLDDEDLKRLAGAIRSSGETLLTILNDILDFSKIEAGRLELERAPFSLVELAQRIEAAHGFAAAQKGVRLTVTAAPDAGRRRIGDAVRVLQIMHNLVGNAVKFTASGVVEMTIDAPVRRPVRIRVSDSGVGMSPEQLNRLFEPFMQAEASTTRRFGGTGLGMSIVKSLTGLMGGTVAVESREGEGTTVEVFLPLPVAAPGLALADAAAAPVDLSGLRVLAADDNEINRMVLDQMLQALEVEAKITAGGREVVEAAAARDFDAMLLDISMPEIDGVEALAMIRAAEAASGRPRVPAIAVTANAYAHQIESYRAAGFDAHVAKPVNLRALREALAEVAAPAADRRAAV